MTSEASPSLDPVIAGPILRKVEANAVHLWLATSQDYSVSVSLADRSKTLASDTQCSTLKMGQRLYLKLISVTLSDALPADQALTYQVNLDHAQTLSVPSYQNAATTEQVDFIWHPKVSSLLHGSCRKAHYGYHQMDTRSAIGDGLAQADHHLSHTPMEHWPSMLVLSGDQVYADDVAGPMLSAIRQSIALLGISEEQLPCSDKCLATEPFFYNREALLPLTELSDEVKQQFFKGKKKPVFTTDTAHNHLISFAEVICMYLLVWSPTLWKYLSLELPDSLTDEAHKARFLEERKAIEDFVSTLPQVQRVLAHLPTAMMFDDHDVTDDWNLTADWETTAYGHALSKRIIGNALTGYLLCQGWGNNPGQYDQAFLNQAQRAIQSTEGGAKDDFIETLLSYEQWHYQWDTEPKLVVLDTRTRRWRSEQNFNHPSGLMDWEAITDLQHDIKDLEAVILVSPAPIFGVKLIEAIQKVFTWIGKPLMVDAENWMSHRGSAYALMNLFTHPKTPSNFVILSGDVHYSFTYDIKLRGQKSSPNIWQITSSGLRNEFPHDLLEWFDRLNRWLYAPWSPLNIFTKRRSLKISPRKPEHAARGERLVNHSGIGLVRLDEQGRPSEITQLCNDQQSIRFLPAKKR
ncbi:PhoD-like phosphatase [Marinomonas aquimarina]|uniref:PhoD-like phosphatase n=1 Tax=Marinomonas aquimarina TaxID=295068 RepID=A0A1A8T9L6_9GAMM|nr:hypothetical protein [Marinomonas aquimarina]SBS28103.1 PhoD-like phosphatase [Marinomonas aquimarina]